MNNISKWWAKLTGRPVTPQVPKRLTTADLIELGVPVGFTEGEKPKYSTDAKVQVGNIPVQIIRVESQSEDRFLVEYEDGSREWRAETPQTAEYTKEIARKWYHRYLVQYSNKSRYWAQEYDLSEA